MSREERDEKKAVELSSQGETTTHTPVPLAQEAKSRRVESPNMADIKEGPTVNL